MSDDCWNCRFWKWQEDGDEMGICRRHAPSATAAGLADVTEERLWPTTHMDWWCGEWSPKPTDQTPATDPR